MILLPLIGDPGLFGRRKSAPFPGRYFSGSDIAFTGFFRIGDTAGGANERGKGPVGNIDFGHAVRRDCRGPRRFVGVSPCVAHRKRTGGAGRISTADKGPIQSPAKIARR